MKSGRQRAAKRFIALDAAGTNVDLDALGDLADMFGAVLASVARVGLQLIDRVVGDRQPAATPGAKVSVGLCHKVFLDVCIPRCLARESGATSNLVASAVAGRGQKPPKKMTPVRLYYRDAVNWSALIGN